MDTERRPNIYSDLLSEYEKFKETAGFTYSLGIIGGSEAGNLDIIHSTLLEGCKLAQYNVGNFAIVSGGTYGGVPELAIDVGKELGLPTIGIFPEDGAKYAATDKLDFSISVPPQPLSQVKWGIETPTLVSIPNAFVLIGGSWGTLAEVSMIMKANVSKAGKDLPVAPIIVLNNTGMLADELISFSHSLPTPDGSIILSNSSEELSAAIMNHFNAL